MYRFLVWLLVMGTVLLYLVGCSDQPGNVVAPINQQSSSTHKSPLLPKSAGGQYIDSAYIVVFNADVSDVDNEVDQIRAQYGVQEHFRYKYALKGFAATLSGGALAGLQHNPHIASIEQDQIAHAVTTQTNPPSWGLDRVDQHTLPLSSSYTYNQDGAGVDAYIIDTGILTSHTDFGGRAVSGYDAVTSGGSALDGNGHGTHVAGTVGGSTYGIAKGVRLVAVRVLDNSGSGTYSQVIAGIDWVTANHTAHSVANMSLGGSVSSTLDDAVRNSIASGVTYCIAAGNSSVDASTQSPADVAEAITVGATTSSDGFASFSNYGSVVDLLAPGVNITSDWNTSNTATNTISGTSMATPHATGAAALYLEANPSATPAAVASALAAAASQNVISGVPSGTANRLLYTLTGSTTSAPSSPALSTPANGATGVTVPASLSWNASSGATSYRVQVSASSIFSSIVFDQSGLTTTSASVSGLSSGTIYYWHVNATNATGTSGWSATWSFTTAGTVVPAAPAAPVLVSPANFANNVPRTATFQWNSSTGAASYRLQLSTSSTFATLAYDGQGLTSTSATVSGLGRRTTYYWRVTASNTNGTSAWSTVWQFKTGRQ